MGHCPTGDRLCPAELSRFGTFDTKHLREICEVGYEAAQESMDEILAALSRGRAEAPD